MFTCWFIFIYSNSFSYSIVFVLHSCNHYLGNGASSQAKTNKNKTHTHTNKRMKHQRKVIIKYEWNRTLLTFDSIGFYVKLEQKSKYQVNRYLQAHISRLVVAVDLTCVCNFIYFFLPFPGGCSICATVKLITTCFT